MLIINMLMQSRLSVLLNIFLWIGNVIAFYIMYIGLREGTEKGEIVKDDVKVESELFRIATTRPKNITYNANKVIGILHIIARKKNCYYNCDSIYQNYW